MKRHLGDRYAVQSRFYFSDAVEDLQRPRRHIGIQRGALYQTADLTVMSVPMPPVARCVRVGCRGSGRMQLDVVQPLRRMPLRHGRAALVRRGRLGLSVSGGGRSCDIGRGDVMLDDGSILRQM